MSPKRLRRNSPPAPDQPSLIRLNLGSGSNKLPDFINIDLEATCKPDLCFDFTAKPLPYEDGAVEEIVLFHTIEHIGKRSHLRILSDFWRVLRPGGRLLFSYPEFTKAYENWRTNFRGHRDFWENVLYGRQLYPGDAHVCIMHTPYFKKLLLSVGFVKMRSTPEKYEKFNTILSCLKGDRPLSYEDTVKSEMEKFKLRRVKPPRSSAKA